MDHAQGRAFHHHLARAIMHLNHLAGLLPFFEPSIEWDDPMLDQQFRLGRPTHTSRSLHTFVPLPSASNPPTMVSNGGFLLSEPVAFRRVYGLESYSRTSKESNHHRQSVSDTRVPRYQLHHEDDYDGVTWRHSVTYDCES